jgi:hypothetical protein
MKKNLAFLLVLQASKNFSGNKGTLEGKEKSPHQNLGSAHAKMMTLGTNPSFGGCLFVARELCSRTARKSGLDGCIQVFIGCGHPIQTQARATW